VYEHCAPRGFEINAISPGSRKGISLIQPQSSRELALQIGTSILRLEIPNSFDMKSTESITIHDIPCTLPEGGQILCSAEFTARPLSIRFEAASGKVGFDWFWLTVHKIIFARQRASEILNLGENRVFVGPQVLNIDFVILFIISDACLIISREVPDLSPGACRARARFPLILPCQWFRATRIKPRLSVNKLCCSMSHICCHGYFHKGEKK